MIISISIIFGRSSWISYFNVLIIGRVAVANLDCSKMDKLISKLLWLFDNLYFFLFFIGFLFIFTHSSHTFSNLLHHKAVWALNACQEICAWVASRICLETCRVNFFEAGWYWGLAGADAIQYLPLTLELIDAGGTDEK